MEQPAILGAMSTKVIEKDWWVTLALKILHLGVYPAGSGKPPAWTERQDLGMISSILREAGLNNKRGGY